MLLACVAYFIVNTLLVAGAIALERGLPLIPTWQTNYAYRNAVLSSGGALRALADAARLLPDARHMPESRSSSCPS